MDLIIILIGLLLVGLIIVNAHDNDDFNDEYEKLLDDIHEKGD